MDEDRVESVRIADVLLPALRERFPGRPFVEAAPPQPIAVFPASHPAVGDLQILDEGNEATVIVGAHTHGHFNPYNAELTAREVAEHVTASVLGFLDKLFADRILIWSIPGQSGGWKRAPSDATTLPPGANAFVWSGPLDG